MRIGVIGGGKIASTLGGKWAASGHDVTFGLRDPSGPRAGELRGKLGDVRISHPAEAAATAEAVLIAIPGTAVPGLLEALAEPLSGKIVFDATNRLDGGPTDSLSEYPRLAPGARVVRAFNTLGWEVFADPRFGEDIADHFFCSGEPEREVAETLIRDLGLRPVWLGDLDQASSLDGLTRLYFALARRHGRHIALRFLDRPSA